MKIALIALALLTSNLALARTSEIECRFNSNSDLQMTLIKSNGKVLEASLYNSDWSERAQDHFQSTISSVSMDSSQIVTLKDGTTLEIPLAVIAGDTGTVIVNGENEYSCN